MRQRVIHYDVLSGLMLLFMMHHHVCGMCGLMESPIHMIPYKLLYFYIPYFFFKAGCFYNPDKDIRLVFLESSKRLLVPFFVFSLMGYVLFGAIEPMNTWHYWWYPIRQIFAIGRVEGNGPLWFLLSLFIVRLLFQTSRNSLWKQICWIVAGGCIGIIGNYYGIRPRTISNVGMGIFFYGLGFLMRNLQYNKKVGNILLLLFVLIYIAMIPLGWHLVDFSLNRLEIGCHPMWMINCVIACVVVNYLFRNYSWEHSPLAWIGEHSMIFLCIHSMIYELLHQYIYTKLVVSSYSMLCVDWISVLLICSTMVFVFQCKFLCWMVGEKRAD